MSALMLAVLAVGLSPVAQVNAGVGPEADGIDNAELLVEVIHTTIDPHVWDVNGGHGAIIVFGPFGGVAGGGRGGRGGGGGGLDLVEVIQTTVDPETWDVNGGPGTIILWGD